MRVQVKDDETGYFDHIRRREGDVFTIPDEPRRPLVEIERRVFGDVVDAVADANGTIPLAFSFKWMTPVRPSTPERITSAPEALKQSHDRVLAEKAGQRSSGGTGNQEVI
jgi:hypothetical protein